MFVQLCDYKICALVVSPGNLSQGNFVFLLKTHVISLLVIFQLISEVKLDWVRFQET